MKFRPLLPLLSLVLWMAGCGGRELVKKESPATAAPPVTATPATGPQAPSLVDFHAPVSDQEYQSALAAVGNAEVDRRNAAEFLTIAQYQYNHSSPADALRTYQKILLSPGAAAQADKAQYMAGQIYYERKDYLPALAAFQKVGEKYPGSPYLGQSRQMMDFILSYSMNLDDLARYVANYPNSPVLCTALFQLGSHEAQSGLQAGAQEHLNQFLQQCPQHASAPAAQLLLQSLQSQIQGKSWKIAVLVPRTGRYKSFGDSVLNGIMLAMEQANQAGGSHKPMSVVVRDTAGDPIKAVKWFQELSKDNSLDAVIGPLVTAEIAAVAPLAVQQKVALITPSIGPGDMYSLGPYLFSNSMTNEMQGKSMAQYAVEHLGMKRFAVLAPADGYGQTLADSFQRTVEALGGTLTASQTYPPGSTDFKKQLVSLGGQDPESCKENDRENARRLEELKYGLDKEIGKILLKAKDLSAAAQPVPSVTPAVALVPFVEALTNTACPSALRDVNQALRDAFKDRTDYLLRNDDLARQALTRLPADARGNTREVSADQWGDVAQDLQASILIAGQVVETNPPNDWGNDPTWDYTVNLQAFRLDPARNAMVKFYQSKIPYSLFKPCTSSRGNADFQALYLPAHAAEIPLLAAQVHYYALNPVFLGGHYWDNDTVLQEGARDLEGSYFATGFYVDSQQAGTKTFVDDYLKRFAERPNLLAAQAYDAARLLLQATNGASGRDDIHTNLLATKDFNGVSGKTTFAGRGQADKVVPVLKIQGGKYQQVQ